MIKVNLKGLAVDSTTGMPVLLLADEENQNSVYPIWIGVPEAEGIVLSLTGLKPQRPLTYDLFKNIIEMLGGRILAVEIVDKVNDSYIANILIETDGKEVKVDSRPSDAINLAIRFGAPIYLNEDVIEKVDIHTILPHIQENQTEVGKAAKEEKQSITDDDLEKFKSMLENIKPDDFALNKGETV